jgi:hemerythrin-like domain-containing protein
MGTTQESANFQALDACHQKILVHLSSLSALIQRVESAGVDDVARHMAGEIEAFFSDTSRQHHAEEERTVFPPLLSKGDTDLSNVVHSLQQDHGWIEENWIELAPQLRAIALGNTWTDAAEFLHYAEVFVDLCREHIALEESMVYPQSKAHWAAVLASRSARLAKAS